MARPSRRPLPDRARTPAGALLKLAEARARDARPRSRPPVGCARFSGRPGRRPFSTGRGSARACHARSRCARRCSPLRVYRCSIVEWSMIGLRA
jgi:hypothetical protein